jgi:2,4-dienoyl-CoA reductase-like NADH-dependent reductase (Old Yellow Enzyme family)
VLSDEERGWLPVAPSAVPFKEGDKIPHELTKDEIKKVIADFRDAAARALTCGFKVVEIHAAHGYLINEFYSPVSNLRTDEYGGSFENRIRLLLEIIEAVKSVWPKEYPLFVRITSSEWSDKGWQIDDSVRLAVVLKERGVDLIDCSSGGNVYKAKIEVGPLYQVPFAEKIKKGSGIMTGAVGLITTPQECEQILQEGKADVILLARQLLREPYFPLRAAKELGVDVKWPDQYLRAKQ